MRRGVSWFNRRLYHVGDSGLMEFPIGMTAFPPVGGYPLLMVHGFRYDPRSTGRDNPHLTTFEMWKQITYADNRAFGFGWYSVPLSIPSLLSAWKNGRWNTYRYAWDLAKETSLPLSSILYSCTPGADIMCHSLGSRVVLQALKDNPKLDKVRTVLLLNGAEYSETALEVAKMFPKVRFHNIVVQTDDVLAKFGGLFAPEKLYGGVVGQRGLGKDAPENWIDIVLDHPKVKEWGWKHNFLLNGNDPTRISDHWYSFRNPGNWPLYRHILDTNIVDPPRVL